MHKIITIVFLLFYSVFSFSQEKSTTSNFTGTLTILHTNDIHGNFSRFPRLAFVVDSIRQGNKHVLLFNAGDLFTGNPLVDMNEEKGYQMIELMNKIGYDLSVLGNHEFDYGQVVLAKRISEAHFPFICANIQDDGNNFPIPKPTANFIIDNSLNINVLSVIQISTNDIPDTHPERVKGLKFNDPFETAKKFEYLKDSSNLFIALTHLGKRQDIKLAEKLSFFDIIIGGHSHSKIDTIFMINNTLITQAASHLNYLGVVTVDLKNGKIVEKKSKLISLRSGAVDEKFQEMVNKYEQNSSLNEVVGSASEDIKGEEELGSFFADAMKEEANLDIAVQNSGGIRINRLPKGDIKREQVYKLDPFGNYLMVLDMTVDEIKSLIKSSFRGNIDLRVSGIKYTLDTENGILKDINITDYQGNKLDNCKLYKVGMNDYILSSYKFEHHDPGESFGLTTAELLISYLNKNKNIDYQGVQRTFIKPL